MSKMSNKFIEEVMEEEQRTRKLYPNFHSFHEAMSVIREEYEECWAHVKTNPYKAGITQKEYKKMMRSEAKQIAAMCVRYVEDLCTEDETK